MEVKSHIPNTITLLNLVFGCIAISLIVQGNVEQGAKFIIISLVMDFLDGFSARTLNAYSDTGKQLDSLADMVSFGVAPAMILHILIVQDMWLTGEAGSILSRFVPYLPFILPVFSAIRLARFNIDEEQATYFKGLPTPASAIVVISLPYIRSSHDSLLSGVAGDSWFLIMTSVILSFLMVSGIRFFSLKFRNASWQNNRPQYILIIVSAALFFALGAGAIPLIVVLYLLLSLIFKSQPINT
jgi:CDP-diacylglycerol--serine O-phosphatidyltransferase